MKKNLLIALSLFCTIGVSAQNLKLPELHFTPPPRKIKVNKNIKQIYAENGKIYFGIVVPADAGKPAEFAAQELAYFLGKALKAKIPVAKTRNANWKHAIFLGDTSLSRKAGLNVSGLTRDGFLMRTVGRDLYIAGIDDKKSDTKYIVPRAFFWGERPMMHQRGTLFGAYDFLERFAGIRFYLPIDLGIIVPQLKKLEVATVDIFDRPDCAVRTSTAFGQMYSKKPWMDPKLPPRQISNLAMLRWRAGTRDIPNCHGLQQLGYWKRFGKTHPEYFIRDVKGKRQTGWPGYLCLNSNVIHEIIEDAKSALRGEPPQKRGVLWTSHTGGSICYWFPMVYNKDGFFNVHLMDGLKACYCDKCKGKSTGSEPIWKMTATVAKAIQEAKLPAWITQMGYNSYREVPKVDLPDNVIVQLAFNGPYHISEKSKIDYEHDLIRRWNKKLNGRKIWLWVYLDAKDEGQDWCSFPGISQNSPHAIAKYFQDIKNDFSGCFVETAANPKDWINIYVSMRVMWDTNLNINTVMDEFYSLMFGKAAPILKPYFREAENIWIHKVRSQSIETPLGPKPIKQPDSKIWEQYFPPALLKKWVARFDKAEAAVKNSPEHLARVKFIRKYFLDSTLKNSALYWKNKGQSEILQANVKTVKTPVVIDGKLNDAVWKTAIPNYLGKFRFGTTPIRASVKVLKDSKNLYFAFESIDLQHDQLDTGTKVLPGQRLIHFATFELLLNPSGDKETVYHLLINPSGKFQALKQPAGKAWKANYKVATFIGKDRWTAEVAIPLKQLPGLKQEECRANFSYNRQQKNTKPCSDLYTWSPYLQTRFYEPDHFAKLVFTNKKSINLLNDFDFAGLEIKGRTMGKHWGFGEFDNSSVVCFDENEFVTGGQSISMESDAKYTPDDKASARVSYRHTPRLVPGKKYRLSYYVKGELSKNSIMDARIWGGKTRIVPEGRLTGKFPWMRVSREFIALNDGKFGLGFNLYGGGKVWFDHVVLQEVKD